MKYQRSWLPLRVGRIAVDPGGPRPTACRTRLNQSENPIDEIETAIRFRTSWNSKRRRQDTSSGRSSPAPCFWG
jgi:hypothetical protein